MISTAIGLCTIENIQDRVFNFGIDPARKLLEDYGRVNVDMAMNDKNKFTEGSYTRLEWLLLQLELLSDHFPRANLKYQIRKEDKYSTPSERKYYLLLKFQNFNSILIKL